MDVEQREPSLDDMACVRQSTNVGWCRWKSSSSDEYELGKKRVRSEDMGWEGELTVISLQFRLVA